MPVVVPCYVVQKFLNEVRPFRSRAHYTHIALKNIDELRQLIQARLSQKCAKACSPHITLSGPVGVALRAGAKLHGTKLQHVEKFPVKSQTVLPEKHRPGRRVPNSQHD